MLHRIISNIKSETGLDYVNNNNLFNFSDVFVLTFLEDGTIVICFEESLDVKHYIMLSLFKVLLIDISIDDIKIGPDFIIQENKLKFIGD